MHVWSSFRNNVWKILNNVYSRLWRRVLGQPRFKSSPLRDCQVRKVLGIPSLDCVLRKRRLKYISRLARCELPPLHALLQAKNCLGKALPWVELIVSDLKVLMNTLPNIFSTTPPPDVDPQPIWDLVCKFPREWREIVDLYYIILYPPTPLGITRRVVCIVVLCPS